MYTSLNLDQMEINEKFLIMEQIWENLSTNAMAQGFTPKWHLDLLENREKKAEEGSALFSDLTDVKTRLQKFANEN